MADTIFDLLAQEPADNDRPPKLPSVKPPRGDAASVLDAVKSLKAIVDVREGVSGSVLDKSLTMRDLIKAGVLQVSVGGRVYGSNSSGSASFGSDSVSTDIDPRPWLEVPPTPTNLQAAGMFRQVYLQWDLIAYQNHVGVEIWRASTDSLGAAVLIGTSTANIYLDEAPGSGTKYYWVRAFGVSRAGATIYGAYNAVAGMAAAVALNPAEVLPILAGQITETELFSSLADRINLIDGSGIGSVNARIASEATIRQDQDTSLATQIALISAGVGEQFDSKFIWHFDAGLEGWHGSGTATVSGGLIRPNEFGGGCWIERNGISFTGTEYPTLKYRVRKIGAPTWTGEVRWAVGGGAYGAQFLAPEPSWDANGFGIVTYAPGWTGNVTDILIGENPANVDGSNYYEYDWIAVGRPSPGASVASVLEEKTARIAEDGALASSISTLGATVDSNTAAISAESSARASLDGSVQALYTVRAEVSSGGRTVVGGFGLAGTATATQGPRIDFGVRADRFWVSAPSSDPSIPDVLPFVVQTTDQTVNGVLIPKGVYMDAAYIKNLSALTARLGNAWIDNAMVASMSAAKVTFGEMSGDRIAVNTLNGNRITANSIVAGQIDSRGLSIKDGAGNVLFNAGSSTPLAWSAVGSKPSNVAALVGTESINNDLIRTGGTNLLGNSGFMRHNGSLPVGWFEYNNASTPSTKSVQAGGMFGQNYFRITANADTYSSFGIATATEPESVKTWEPGKTYCISLWARGSGGAAGKYIEPFFSNYGWASTEYLENPAMSGDWQRHVYRCTVNTNPLKTSSGELYISWPADGSALPAGSTIDLCCIKVELGSQPSAWAPGPMDTLNTILEPSITAAANNASSALTAVNDPTTGLAQRLRSNAQNVLAGPGGFSSGTLTWDSGGNRTGGYGVGFTQNGLAGYNAAGNATFSVSAATGDATFAGTLSAPNGSLGNVTVADKIRIGKTGYATDTGFLVEWNGGTPRLDIGDSTQYLRWTGTELQIKLNSFTASVGSSISVTNSSDLNPQTLATRSVTVTGGTSPYTYVWTVTFGEVGGGATVYLTGDTSSSSITVVGDLASLAGGGNGWLICTVTDSTGRVAVGRAYITFTGVNYNP